MILLPAIDLMDGRCVRLRQGDFATAVAYSDNPVAALAGFAAQGATEVHIVDLDGARTGEPRQHMLLQELARSTPIQLQIAGGIRNADQVEALLSAGVRRVVVGSLAIVDPTSFARLLDDIGADRLTLALDVRITDGRPMVAIHGWAEGSGVALDEVLGRFPLVRHLLVTDIARDGMLDGPNTALMQAIVADYPQVQLQASGGVSGPDDLKALRRAGAARAIVGKAIWEGRFSVAEGLEVARG